LIKIFSVGDKYALYEKEGKDNSYIGDNKGYLSHSLKHFQLGIKMRGQWVGDEVLVYKDGSMPFSAVARERITVLEISRDDFKHRLPKDYTRELKRAHGERWKWQVGRMMNIASTTGVVQKMDRRSDIYGRTQESIL